MSNCKAHDKFMETKVSVIPPSGRVKYVDRDVHEIIVSEDKHFYSYLLDSTDILDYFSLKERK